MYWTFELAEYLNGAHWPATKASLLDYCINLSDKRVPQEVLDNLEELEDDIEYESIDDIWSDRPNRADYYYENDDER